MLIWVSEKQVARTGPFTAEVCPDGHRWSWRVLRREPKAYSDDVFGDGQAPTEAAAKAFAENLINVWAAAEPAVVPPPEPCGASTYDGPCDLPKEHGGDHRGEKDPF